MWTVRCISAWMLLSLLLALPASAEKVCIKAVLAGGKIRQTIRNVASSAKCPAKFKLIVDTATLIGPEGQRGEQGERGEQGAQGPAGGFTAQLPSGETMMGTWGGEFKPTAANQNFGTTVTFPFALSAEPTVHIVEQSAAAPAECPGTAANPAAQAGHLCLFELNAFNRAALTTYNPSTASINGSKYGFLVTFNSGGGSSVSLSYGTWAATAP
jgi:hypothetical protein